MEHGHGTTDVCVSNNVSRTQMRLCHITIEMNIIIERLDWLMQHACTASNPQPRHSNL